MPDAAQNQPLKAASGDAFAKLRARREAVLARVPRIGEKMPDGSLYAGVSPDTGRPLYAMPKDADIKVNFNRAAEHAALLNKGKALGHDDWRVPTRGELAVLFNARSKGGFKDTFDESGQNWGGWYWSSEVKEPQINAWNQSFQTGKQSNPSQSCRSSVRCVR